MAKTTYQILNELQTNARKRDIELETQDRGDRETQWRDRRPVQSDPMNKRTNPVDQRVGGQKGLTHGMCGKGHEGPYQSGSTCYLCGKEGNLARNCSNRFHVCFKLQPDGSHEGGVSSDFGPRDPTYH